jgi:ribosomal protein S10
LCFDTGRHGENFFDRKIAMTALLSMTKQKKWAVMGKISLPEKIAMAALLSMTKQNGSSWRKFL